MEITGIINNSLKNVLVGLLRKILYHIGLGTCKIKQNDDKSGNIMIKLFDL